MTPTRGALLGALLLCGGSEAVKRRTGRDWGKMTDADWDEIEKEWETPEEAEEYAFKPPTPKVEFDVQKLERLQKSKKAKKNPQIVNDYVASTQQKSGPAMMFATIDYPGCCEKKASEEIAARWTSMLHTTGMASQGYVVENDTVLFSTQEGLFAEEIRDFVLQQPECVAVEWNSVRTPGPAETEEWKRANSKAKAEKEEANAARRAKEDAEKARVERMKTKRRRENKRKKAAAKSEL